MTLAHEAPPGDEDFDSLIAGYEASNGGAITEAQLLAQQVARELRILRARHAAKQAFDEEQAATTDDARATPLPWADFLSRNLNDVDWLPGKLVARGQQMALVGDGKAGKSLLALEWAWRAAAGLPFLGDTARDPIRVLYVDQENSHDDIQSRMLSLGCEVDQLTNLVYLSFPVFRPLTTAGGGGDLMRAIESNAADLVFLDTISRMVEGKENDSDTWLELYRHTLKPLKAAGVASVRLDHFGKDKTRGARGSSAKTQDVDHVWELAAEAEDRLTLERTHTRTGIGEGKLFINRLGEQVGGRWKAGGTRHVLAAHQSDAAQERPLVGEVVKALARVLDQGGVPVSWGRPKVAAWLRENGHRVSDVIAGDLVKFRQSNPF